MKKFKPTKMQLEIMKEGWALFENDYDEFLRRIRSTEKCMQKETGIESLEFVHDTMCTGWVGIGTFPPDMELQPQEELIK